MSRLDTLTDAIAYIEQHLCDVIAPDDVAAHCHYSLSAMQKLFRHTFRMGLADYIARRRLTLASRELLTTEDSVLDVALRCGYESHEVFTRAFRRIWGVTPSKFRRERSFADIFPRLRLPTGGLDLSHKHYDITELYDTLRSLHGTYALVFDTQHLDPINKNYGHAAGDLVIAECLRRIDMAKGPDMVLFRIGGDEFVLLTGLTDQAQATALAQAITSHNGEPIVFEGQDIPVSLHSGVSQLDTAKRLNYINFFRTLDQSIRG
ncbi:MAG: helix-turn-helix domain-containing protein [Clostridia bacterium]|nr:helix-turn-helix domain-containing protein [Clostridia bacterium]